MKYICYGHPKLPKKYFDLSPSLEEEILCDSRLSINYQGFDILTQNDLEGRDPAKYSIEADRLVMDNDFKKYIETILELYEFGCKRFRIKDIGVLQYFLELKKADSQKYSEIRFLLNLESGGFHNLESLLFYEEKFGSIIERFIVSTEITKNNLEEILKTIKTPIELYGLGPILLFYTPRKLLGNQLKEHLQEVVDQKQDFFAVGTSMESPHSGFGIFQNLSGTLMYAPNHFCLLDMIQDLEKIGVRYLRYDTRGLDGQIVENIIKNHTRHHSKDDMLSFKKIYPVRVLKGLFVVNKSKVLFKKLKNQTLQNVQNHNALVVEVVKDSHMLICQHSDVNLKVGDQVFIQSPDGREKTVKLKWIKNLRGENCEKTEKGKHFIIPIVPAISIKSKMTIV